MDGADRACVLAMRLFHTHTHTHTQAQIMEKNKCTLINTLECAFTFVFPNFA